MAERLNALAYAHHMSDAANPASANYDPNFNPRSVSFDVRTPQELAAVNEFLITLGRDVAAGNPRRRHPPAQASGMSQASDGFPSQTPSYFDAAGLSQLGLSGMPGMPGSGATYSDTGLPSGSGSMHYPQSQPYRDPSSTHGSQFNPLYPNMHDSFAYPEGYLHRGAPPAHHGEYEYGSAISTPYQRSPQSHLYSSPPYDAQSPHSSVSTPSNAASPHITSMPDTSAFGYMRETRGLPTAHLGSVNYTTRSLRDIVPLKAAPGSSSSSSAPPGPVEPKLTKTVHRGPPAKLASSVASSSFSKPGSLYPLLACGDTSSLYVEQEPS